MPLGSIGRTKDQIASSQEDGSKGRANGPSNSLPGALPAGDDDDDDDEYYNAIRHQSTATDKRNQKNVSTEVTANRHAPKTEKKSISKARKEQLPSSKKTNKVSAKRNRH